MSIAPGPRGRMSKARLNGPSGHWPRYSQVSLVPSRPYVRRRDLYPPSHLSHLVCLQTLATMCSKSIPEDSSLPKPPRRIHSEPRICLPSSPTLTSLQRCDPVQQQPHDKRYSSCRSVQDDTNIRSLLDPCTSANESTCHVYPRAPSREDRRAEGHGPDKLGAQVYLHV